MIKNRDVMRPCGATLLAALLGVIGLCRPGAAGTVRIGAIMSTLSGTVTDQRLGADLAVTQINLDPSILGGDTLEIIHLDDGGEVWGGLRAACELVHSGIHGIVGPTYSSVSLGVARLTTALQVRCCVVCPWPRPSAFFFPKPNRRH